MPGNEWLVIGLGNPDCADDGVGPLVASRVHERDLPNVRTLIRRGDALALLEDWVQWDRCIVVDAAAGTAQAGTIHRIDLAHENLPHELSLSSTHAIGLAEAIALARTLGQLPKQLIIYAIEGSHFTCGTTMTPAVRIAVPEVVQRITREMMQQPACEKLIHA